MIQISILTVLVLIKLLAANEIFVTNPKNFTVGIGDTGLLLCQIEINDDAQYGKFSIQRPFFLISGFTKIKVNGKMS